MSNPLLMAIAVGPVQEFIRAARKTRDLWFGSHVLSEISKAAAASVTRVPGCGHKHLILPSVDDVSDLEPGTPLVVPNIIVAELPASVQEAPEKIADQAEKQAKQRWMDLAKEAMQEAEKKARGCIRKDVWDSQVDDVVEFYAAWVPLPRAPDEYQAAHGRLMRLLAGRKNCRRFDASKMPQWGLPKSSLDGARDTVLAEAISGSQEGARMTPPGKPAELRQRLRLRKGEHLDAVGLTKRWGGGNQPYPSVSRIAADPWIRKAQGEAAFGELVEACEALARKWNLPKIDEKEYPQFGNFPYEGSLVYRTRHAKMEMAEENQRGIEDLNGIKAALEKLVEHLGEPDPYMAVLRADGDRMGKAVSDHCPRIEYHRLLVSCLTRFASDAKEIVQKHQGALVYAGGEDVLAFVPVDRCLACARDLRKDFLDCVTAGLPKVGPDCRPTLSVGIAVGHCMEPLEDLLEFAQEAEHEAKESVFAGQTNRNGLALCIHPRSGVPFSVRDNWSDDKHSLDQRLEQWVDLLKTGTVSNRTAFDLWDLAGDYDHWPSHESAQKEELAHAIEKDIVRRLGRKYSRKTPAAPRGDAIQEPREGIPQELKMLATSAKDADGLRCMANELLAARRLLSGGEGLAASATGGLTAKESG